MSNGDAVELELRRATSLLEGQLLVPVRRTWRRLAHADKYARALISTGLYSKSQVGIFAEDVCKGGAKRWYVGTWAGLALLASPRPVIGPEPELPRHLYEVILEWQPCWLYFDLEFQRAANPGAEPQEIIKAFYAELDAFCTEVLGAPLDMDSVVELDSTSPEKFSKHVIVKRLLKSECNLAFKSNLQAGRIVTEFVAYLKRHAEIPGSRASSLFFKTESSLAPEDNKSDEVAAEDLQVSGNGVAIPRSGGASAAPASVATDACLIDTAVYTRNRCFRTLFSSKFGKNRPLNLVRGTCLGQDCPLQVLHSLAAFVPAGTPLFEHRLISEEAAPDAHRGLKRMLSRLALSQRPSQRLSQRPTRVLSQNASQRQSQRASQRTANRNKVRLEASGNRELFDFLVQTWDKTRQKNEPDAAKLANSSERKTRVQSCIKLGDDDNSFLAVSLVHNRFCFCKGASHKSNGIYLVVDISRQLFWQKCHDVDCHNFRSDTEALPAGLLHTDVPGSRKAASTAEATGVATCSQSVLADLPPAPPLKRLKTNSFSGLSVQRSETSRGSLEDARCGLRHVALPLCAAEESAPVTPPILAAGPSSSTPPAVQRGTERRQVQACGPTQKDDVATQKDTRPTQKDTRPTQKDKRPTQKDTYAKSSQKDIRPTQKDAEPTQKDDESETQPDTECDTESEGSTEPKVSKLPVGELSHIEKSQIVNTKGSISRTTSLTSRSLPCWLEDLLFDEAEPASRSPAPKSPSIRKQSSFCSRFEAVLFEEESQGFAFASSKAADGPLSSNRKPLPTQKRLRTAARLG